MDSKTLLKIMTVLEEIGGSTDVCAEHDMIYLSPPGTFDPDSEEGKKLEEAGAVYDHKEYGWYVNV